MHSPRSSSTTRNQKFPQSFPFHGSFLGQRPPPWAARSPAPPPHGIAAEGKSAQCQHGAGPVGQQVIHAGTAGHLTADELGKPGTPGRRPRPGAGSFGFVPSYKPLLSVRAIWGIERFEGGVDLGELPVALLIAGGDGRVGTGQCPPPGPACRRPPARWDRRRRPPWPAWRRPYRGPAPKRGCPSSTLSTLEMIFFHRGLLAPPPQIMLCGFKTQGTGHLEAVPDGEGHAFQHGLGHIGAGGVHRHAQENAAGVGIVDGRTLTPSGRAGNTHGCGPASRRVMAAWAPP